MVYRRSRRRYRFGRRHRRRLYRRKMLRRRRRYRRRGRKSASRGSTVSFTTDYPIRNCSYIPAATPDSQHDLNGVGNPASSYPAWSISILPEDLARLPGNSALYTSTADESLFSTIMAFKDKNLLNSSFNSWSAQYDGMRTLQVDYPNYTHIRCIEDYYDLDRLFAIYDRVRINRITVTLTVPERTEGGPNHHLYVMYNKGRGFEAADSLDTINYAVADFNNEDSDIALKGISNMFGMNWLWKQEDLINAGSRNGIRNAKSGWHIRELAYNKPVKISWVPRHARIDSSYTHFIDKVARDNDYVEPNRQMNYANSKRLVSSAVQTDSANTGLSNYAWFTGPLVRLLDADLAPASSYTPGGVDFFKTYGVRAHMYCSCTFTAFNQVDPLIEN